MLKSRRSHLSVSLVSLSQLARCVVYPLIVIQSTKHMHAEAAVALLSESDRWESHLSTNFAQFVALRSDYPIVLG